ncbi:MAG: hypothetical protein KDI36_11895 [Pseudomonadales bacterium]|nr:hypothetical protein [Pseudomonadales bacterium]
MGDDKIISFDDAANPHIFRRKEEKMKSMRAAFKAAREEAMPTRSKPVKKRRKSNRKGKKK